MKYLGCSVQERYVNPLFEVFDGGEQFILSSYRDIEKPLTEIGVYFESGDPREALTAALKVVGVEAQLEEREIADEDWKFAYRRHFKTEKVSDRIYTVPEWEWKAGMEKGNSVFIKLDPGMAFGTGKHETTKACLRFIDEIAATTATLDSFLDMGSGSGILSIAAAKLGFKQVKGFDVDQEAVDASIENAAKNSVNVDFYKFALGRMTSVDGENPVEKAQVVAANILGPLLIRFADEIVCYVQDKLIISGILTELYDEVLAAFTTRGFKEIKRVTLGEWTSGYLQRV